MKTRFILLIVSLLVGVTTVQAQSDEDQLKAFFIEIEDGIFIFEDEYSNRIEFVSCPEAVVKQFDLKGSSSKNKAFLITFIENDNEEYEIVKMQKTTLEKVEVDDSDDDY